MTGLRFLFRVTLRRLDLAAEIYHIKETQKDSAGDELGRGKRLLAMARNLKVHVLLALGWPFSKEDCNAMGEISA